MRKDNNTRDDVRSFSVAYFLQCFYDLYISLYLFHNKAHYTLTDKVSLGLYTL